jgi:hypothetical protein
MLIIKLSIFLNLILYVKNQILFQPKEIIEDDYEIKKFLFKPPPLASIKHQPELNLNQKQRKKQEHYTKCGQVKPKLSLYVANGKKTQHNLWPWNVQLIIDPNLVDDVGGSREHLDKEFCGGTIISKNYILTAAHCFNEALRHKNDEKILNLTAKNTIIVFNSISSDQKGLSKSLIE